MSTSVSLTDAPANWVSAIGTAMAALGTVLTLGFLIYQNIELRRSQQEETLKREAHEEKQQNMWNEQREMLTFEKLKMHKQEFNALLDELERKFTVTFFDRTALYKGIFPNNRLQSSEINIVIRNNDLNALHKASELYAELFTLINRIESNQVTAAQEVDVADSFIRCSGKLRYYLKIEIPNNDYFGDITIGEGRDRFIITNVFSSLKSTSVYGEILKELSDFGGIEFNEPILSGNFYNKPLYAFACSHNVHGGFNVRLGQVGKAFSDIYHIMRINDKYLITDETLLKAFQETEILLDSGLHSLTEIQAAYKLCGIAKVLKQALVRSSDPEVKDKYECIEKLQTAQFRLHKRLGILNPSS
ncbi:hypothetical protein QNE85_003234 [Vibrio fluvialis]|nr:hypothetical protein [Vibrio fluvialis]